MLHTLPWNKSNNEPTEEKNRSGKRLPFWEKMKKNTRTILIFFIHMHTYTLIYFTLIIIINYKK